MVKFDNMVDTHRVPLALIAGSLAAFIRLGCWKAGLVEGGVEPARWGTIVSLLFGAGLSFFALRGLGVDAGVVWAFYIAVLVALSVIDLEEKVIPKKIWIAGLGVALVASWLIPSILGENSPSEGLAAAAVGSVVGGGVIFLMVELGKLLFGKIELSWDEPKDYSIERNGAEWFLSSEGEKMPLSEMFMRKSDSVYIEDADGRAITIWETHMDCGAGREELAPLSGRGKKIILPREAMGFGDVKFMLMAGAMTGWEGAVFAIFAGSLIGTFVGGALKILKGHSEIPFIPFLASGILLFMIFHTQVREMFVVLFGGSQ